jgi:hypothetical protein
MITENLRGRIRKLLQMAEMGTGNEAEVAMAKVREIMLEHGVTEGEARLFRREIPAPARKAAWLGMLARLCGDFSGVVSFEGYKHFVFAGDEIGVDVAVELYNYLKNEMNRQLKKQRITGRNARNSFRTGLIISVWDKLEKTGGWRDMKEKVERIRKELFPNIEEKRSGKTTVGAAAYLEGMKSGAEINVNRQAGAVAGAGYIGEALC